MVTGITRSQGLETVLCHLECIYIPSKHSSVPVCVLGPVQVWTERSQLRTRATPQARHGRELRLGLKIVSRLPKRVSWGPGRSHSDLSLRGSGLGRSHHESAGAVELRFGDGDVPGQTQVPEGEDFAEASLA